MKQAKEQCNYTEEYFKLKIEREAQAVINRKATSEAIKDALKGIGGAIVIIFAGVGVTGGFISFISGLKFNKTDPERISALERKLEGEQTFNYKAGADFIILTPKKP